MKMKTRTHARAHTHTHIKIKLNLQADMNWSCPNQESSWCKVDFNAYRALSSVVATK